MGSVLWVIELFLIVIRSIEAICKFQGRYKTQIGRRKDSIQESEYNSSEGLGLTVRIYLWLPYFEFLQGEKEPPQRWLLLCYRVMMQNLHFFSIVFVKVVTHNNILCV